MPHKYELRTYKRKGEVWVEGPDGAQAPIWKAVQDRKIGAYKLRDKEIRWLTAEESDL